ncbi:MAG: PAAR domain-containing protein [Pseudomonas sp.]|uniref:PAAR domain-containing protein n=1 Tax=Pseudomonas sp. TaxID=306 RepID=UPI003D6EE507
MRNIIRIGDTTTGGGKVQAGSQDMVFGGIGVARVGDPVMCPLPLHGLNAIAEGHPHFDDNGVPVAFDGHRCECGCALITSMPEASAS